MGAEELTGWASEPPRQSAREGQAGARVIAQPRK